MSRRTLPVRRLAVAALAPLALTALVACGSDEDSTAADTSASTTPDADSSEEPEPAGDDVAEGEEIEPAAFMDTFEAAFADATTVHMTMEIGSAMGAISAEGDADYTVSPPNMSLKMAGEAMQGQEMEMVLVDGVMYMQIPTLGEKFLKLDLSDPNNPLGSAFTDQIDPKAMFEGFGDSLEKVVYNGEEEIGGDTTDSYTVTVDGAAVLESQGQTMPPGTEMPDKIEYVVYFTDDGLYRRMEMDMGAALGDVTMDFTDWGTDVSIEAPPSDQVTDFPSAMMPSAGATG